MEPQSVVLRCGVIANILWNSESGDRPLIGALPPTGSNNWIPISWRIDGYHIDQDSPSNLDIVDFGTYDGTKKKSRKRGVQKQVGEDGS